MSVAESRNARENLPQSLGASPFPLRHLARRFLWNISWLLFAAWTPRFCRPWRVFLLRLFGAQIGKNADVRGTARVWFPPNLIMGDHTIIAGRVNCYNMDRVTLHSRSIVSQGSYLCAGTHDIRRLDLPLVTRPIEIGPDAWIAADAFIGPGCRVPARCVVGARAVVFGTLEPDGVYVGNPGKKISQRVISN